MAENQNTNNSQTSANSAVADGAIVVRKTSAEIEAASHKATLQPPSDKAKTLFKPIPKESLRTNEQPTIAPRIQPKKIQPKPIAKIVPAASQISPTVAAVVPKVAAPLPQNSAQIASAAGLTSAQIEVQSKHKTAPLQLTQKLAEKLSPKTKTTIQHLPLTPKTQFKPVAKTAPVISQIASTSKAVPVTTTSKLVSKISSIFKTKPTTLVTPTQSSQPKTVRQIGQQAAIQKISAKNTGASAKTLQTVGASSKPPVAAKPKISAPKTVQDKTTRDQFINHNQIATGNFINKLFGRKKNLSEENSAADALLPEKQTLQRQLAEAEKIYQQGLASVRDLISPSSFEIHYDHLSLSGVFVRSFFVYAYPRFLETNWMSPIINFDATVDVSQFIYPIASDEIMGILKKKVAQIQSSITMSHEKGNVRDPQLETALEDAESLRTDLQRGQEKFFQFGMYFTVYAEDLKKLEATTKIIENQLGGKLILTKRADIQGEHAFNSTLPLCLDEIEVQRNMNTSPLSTTFPFVSSSLATDEGILYGLNRHNNSLIIFDRFKLPNANSCVFASSGAGKSYAVKLELLRQAMLGTDVIIIDPENEYKALTETVGGTYINMSLNSEQRINPFDLPQPFEGEDLKPGDLLRENIISLTGLMRLLLGEMSSAEEALIDKALIDTYAVRGVTMGLQDPSGMPMPTMEDFHSVLSSMKGAEDLAQRLQKYTTGTFGGIFNKETNVNLGSGLITFCIRDLEDELRPSAMFILLNYIWNRVRSELKKRILVVDEAWIMMQHEDAAKFLFGLVKRARKYYLGVTTITQDVEDFLGSKYGRPIVTNASMQLLLKQAPSSMDVLQKTFNLTEGEKYMLLNSGVGQGLFFADSKHVAVQVIASYSENQIVTTNPEEVLNQRDDAFEAASKKDA